MTESPRLAEPGRQFVPRLIVSFIAALALVIGPLAFAPAQAATAFSVSGTVAGEGTGALESVSVEIQKYDAQDDDYQTIDYAFTDQDGAYAFANIPAGEQYRVRVNGTGNFVAALSAEFTLGADKTMSPITLELGGSMSGTVKEAETGTVIADTMVQAYPYNGTVADLSAGQSATVDPDNGSFSLQGLAPGNYKVQISDYYGNHVSEFYNDAADVEHAATVPVAKQVDTPLGDITLDVGASFSGVLEDEDGQPVEDPMLYALRVVDGVADYSNAYTGRLDEDSSTHYTIQGLPAGDYKILFSANNYFDQFYNNKATEAAADAQTIALEDNQDLGTTVLEKTASVTGSVRDTAQAALGDILVEAYPVVGGVVATAATDWAYTESDGTFNMTPVHAGTYRLKFKDGLHRYSDKLGATFTVAGGGTFAAGLTVMAKVPVVVKPIVKPVVKKKAASVKISAKGAKKKATLTITVRASGVTPTGKVTVKLGSKTLKTATLKKGKVVVKLTKQKKGKRAYKVIYSGDSKVLGKTVTSSKVKIK